MKLAVVCGSYQFADSYYVDKVDTMKDALERIAHDGHSVALFCPTMDKTNKVIEHRCVSYRYSGGRGLADCLNAMIQAMRAFGPDGIIIKDFWNPVTPLACTAFPGTRKLLIFCGGKLEPPRVDVDKVMVASEAMAQALVSRGYPEDKIIDRAFGVNAELFVPGDVEKDIDVLYVADWRENKRQSLLIEVMARRTSMKVCVLGAQSGTHNKQYFNECMGLAGRAGVHRNMLLVDRIKGADTVPYYQRSRICIHLGLPTEGGARSPLEAMACELPVIVTTDCLSNCSRIGHLTEGFHVEPQADAIAHAIDYLDVNKKKASELGKSGRAKAKRLWHGRQMENDFREVFGL